jgi:CDP-diacylglycerol--glycerol-3-phosphate 3-phosphatidyltransferase
MTVANKITIFRLILAEISFILLLFDYFKSGFILLLIAVFLDIVDGKVARRLKQVSSQGVFLDIMADKIVIISSFFIIGLKINIIFFYLALLMLLREYSIDTMRSIVASKGKIISADKFSKIKGILFMVSMLGIVANFAFLNNNLIIQGTMISIGILGIIISYITLIRFFIIYKKLII